MVWIAQARRLTAASPHAIMLRATREDAMRAQVLPHGSIWRRSTAS